MTGPACICAKLFPAGSLNYEHIILNVAFQFVFGLVWFGLVFNRWASRAMAIEKGVTDPKYILQRYNELLPAIYSFGGGAVRILSIVAFVNVFGVCSCTAATYVVAALLVALHQRLWSQSMLVTIVLEVAYETAVTFAAAWFYEFLKANYLVSLTCEKEG
jgi:hypothetical protein